MTGCLTLVTRVFTETKAPNCFLTRIYSCFSLHFDVWTIKPDSRRISTERKYYPGRCERRYGNSRHVKYQCPIPTDGSPPSPDLCSSSSLPAWILILFWILRAIYYLLSDTLCFDSLLITFLNTQCAMTSTPPASLFYPELGCPPPAASTLYISHLLQLRLWF